MLYKRNDGRLEQRQPSQMEMVTNKNKNKINQSQMGEYWTETQTGKWKVHWLVDTGIARSFVSQSTSNWLINKLGKVSHQSGRI